MPDQLTYSVADAARAIGIGKNTMYELVAAGRVPHLRIGRSIRIPVASLQAWVLEQAESTVRV